MMKRLLVTFLALFAPIAKAQYVESQVGGYVGFTSLGIGDTFFDNIYDTSLLLGYVPKFIGGEDLWSITWKNNLKWNVSLDNDITYTPIYGGLNLVASFDRDTFWVLPKKYPEGYYPPSGLFWSPNIGTEVRWGKHSVYFELTTLDFYLEAYVRNPDYLTLQDIFTYGVGYKYSLE